MRRLPPLVIAVSLLLAACSGQPGGGSAPAAAAPGAARLAAAANRQKPPLSFSQRLDAAIAGDWRAPADKARDVYRHPRETLTFFGLEPGMRVIEITPGAGWYADILAPLLRGDGSYAAALVNPIDSSYAARQAASLRSHFAAHPQQFADAQIIYFDPKTPNLGTPDSADLVLTFRNVHNWVEAGNAEAMFKAFHRVLAPGGVLGVVDHRAAPGKTLAQVIGTGYLPQGYVIKLAEDAGFKLVATSEINANPKDTKNYPKGVWTLPPTLALGDTDRHKYLAIGESDRMTLKFVKPPSKPASAAGAR